MVLKIDGTQLKCLKIDTKSMLFLKLQSSDHQWQNTIRYMEICLFKKAFNLFNFFQCHLYFWNAWHFENLSETIQKSSHLCDWDCYPKLPYILPNISRSKGNQAIKFGQLIEAFSLKNSMQNGMENLFPDSFWKKTKIQHISGSVV